MEIQNVTETGKSIMGCRPGQTRQSSHFLISFRAALVLFFLLLQLQSPTSVNHREWKRWHMATGEGSDSCHRWDV